MAKPVLIVDDHAEAAAAIGRVVTASGAAPTIITESMGFAGAFRAVSPAAVILDVMMPDRDGIEVLRELAALAPATPVLLVTGHGEVWARMARELGTILGLTRIEMAAKPITRAAVEEFLTSAFADACAD
jgi:FixJ family two-component response regulator